MATIEYGTSSIGYVLTRNECATIYCEREGIPFAEFSDDEEYYALMGKQSWADYVSQFTGSGQIIKEDGELNLRNTIEYDCAYFYIIPLDNHKPNVFKSEVQFANYTEMMEYIENTFRITPRPEGFQKLVGTTWS